MRTNQQKLASKDNGRQSKGPVTTDGKARSAQNATKHGLSSRIVVLASEDKSLYEQMLSKYYDFWKPENQLEFDLVNDIASSRWRLNRIVALETAAIDLELDKGREDYSKQFGSVDEATRCAIAVKSLSDNSNLLNTLTRHESRHRRTIEKATKQLLELQALRAQQEKPNEPEPLRKRTLIEMPNRQNEPNTTSAELTLIPQTNPAPETCPPVVSS